MDITATEMDIIDIVGQFIEKRTFRELDIFFMTTWTIWGNRNQAIHNNASIPPLQAWESAGRVLLHFNNACVQPPLMQPTPHHKWTPAPPPKDFFKVNVDEATLDNGRNSCIGVIIRDCSGNPIGALSKPLPFSSYYFKHLKRDSNRAAHALAREAKLSGQT